MAKRTQGKVAHEAEIEFDYTKGRAGVWVARDGREYLVEDLSDSHLQNIVNQSFGCIGYGQGVGPLRVLENAVYQMHRRPVLLDVVAEGCRRRLIPGKYLSMLIMLKHEIMLQEGLSPKRGRWRFCARTFADWITWRQPIDEKTPKSSGLNTRATEKSYESLLGLKTR